MVSQQNHICEKQTQEEQGSTNPSQSTHWLHLEILSINTMNKIGDKGQPWRTPPIRNESDS